MDAGFGSWTADHADSFAGALARAGIGLGALATHRQSPEMANAPVALNALEALQVHADLAAQIALDDILAILDGVDDLRELLFRQVLRADARIDIRPGQYVF